MGMPTLGGGRPPSSAFYRNLRFPHAGAGPIPSPSVAARLQLVHHPPTAIRGMGVLSNPLDCGHQRQLGCHRLRRLGPLEKGIIATPTDLHHPTQQPRGIGSPLLLDKLISHRDSLAKKAVAFFKMFRSIRSRRFSSCIRCNSACSGVWWPFPRKRDPTILSQLPFPPTQHVSMNSQIPRGAHQGIPLFSDQGHRLPLTLGRILFSRLSCHPCTSLPAVCLGRFEVSISIRPQQGGASSQSDARATSGRRDLMPCKHLYAAATTRPTTLGEVQLVRSPPHRCTVHLGRQPAKGRRHTSVLGQPVRSSHSRKQATRAREPWLLASSLSLRAWPANRIIQIYRQRMQIEEAVRDLKSARDGLGFAASHTRTPQRLAILLLLGALALFVLWLVGQAAVQQNLHHSYQANTTKRRLVLSLGRHLLSRTPGAITIRDLGRSLAQRQFQLVHGNEV